MLKSAEGPFCKRFKSAKGVSGKCIIASTVRLALAPCRPAGRAVPCRCRGPLPLRRQGGPPRRPALLTPPLLSRVPNRNPSPRSAVRRHGRRTMLSTPAARSQADAAIVSSSSSSPSPPSESGQDGAIGANHRQHPRLRPPLAAVVLARFRPPQTPLRHSERTYSPKVSPLSSGTTPSSSSPSVASPPCERPPAVRRGRTVSIMHMPPFTSLFSSEHAHGCSPHSARLSPTTTTERR